MIPKRSNALRISQEPFAFEEALPDMVESASPTRFDPIPEEPVTRYKSETKSMFDTLSESSISSATVPDMGPPTKGTTHHPQVIDQDVEDFTMKLDGMIGHFRNESVKEFLTMKRSILHE
jgi:hypothetical protein